MNSTNNPSLPLEQQRLIRQAQQTVRAHTAEIDAAVDAAKTVDEHADQLDAAAKTARTVRRHPATIRTAQVYGATLLDESSLWCRDDHCRCCAPLVLHPRPRGQGVRRCQQLAHRTGR